jgi:DNA-binding GntR family transcriptional regulator
MGAAPDPEIQAIADHLREADLLDPAEIRELVPSLLILESVAVRESPPFDAEALAELRAANQRLQDAAGDTMAAAQADDDFHRHLTGRCGNARLLEVVSVVRKALLRYERLYLLSPERLARSVEQHEAIVVALESGDHELAADRVRENYTAGIPAPDARLHEPDR